MNKLLGISTILLALIFIGAGCVTNQSPEANNQNPNNNNVNTPEQNTPQPTTTNDNQININPNNSTNNNESEAAKTKTFTINGSNFFFDPKEIKVKKGDKVKIEFVNKDGFHDLVIDEFNVKTPQIATGKTATIEFIANKTGTFEYYCSVGEHRQMGMVGKLIVE